MIAFACISALPIICTVPYLNLHVKLQQQGHWFLCGKRMVDIKEEQPLAVGCMLCVLNQSSRVEISFVGFLF